jgi:hypothetical protein
MAWSASAKGDDMDNALERVAHQALMEFYEQHLEDTAGTHVALFPIRDKSNWTWRRRMAAACNAAHLTHHKGWALIMQYA